MTRTQQKTLKVVIVGGFIAGLTLAHSLLRVHIDFVVLESNANIAPQVGASIGILPNGARILDQVGVWDDVYATVETLHSSFTWTAEGKLIIAKSLKLEGCSILHTVLTLSGTTREPEPLPEINISITTSSTTLYKYHFGKPFIITAEATLSPLATQPLTVLVLDTPLDRDASSWFEHNLILTNTETSEVHGTLPGYCLSTDDESSLVDDELNPPVHRQAKRFFATLRPGRPYRVTHVLSAELAGNMDIGIDIERYKTSIVGACNLHIGSTYEISLHDAACWIRWYRFGRRREVLSGYRSMLSPLRHPSLLLRRVERVNHSDQLPIPLKIQYAQRFTVARTEELTRLAHIADQRYVFRIESEPDYYFTLGSIDPDRLYETDELGPSDPDYQFPCDER